MTSTTTDVFAQAGYAVRTTMVDRVDNQGEPCGHCVIEGRYIDATVYGVDSLDQVSTTVDCCVCCVPAVIRRMDGLYLVTVELGDSLPKWTPPVVHPTLTDYLHGDDADNGLMAHQDDTRPHPDAL